MHNFQEFKSIFVNNLPTFYSSYEVESIFFIWLEHYGVSKLHFLLQKQDAISDTIQQAWQQDNENLRQGMPIQYVIGKAYFENIVLNVTTDTLIPRPETAELVNWILETQPNSIASLVDIGTGSGCIPILLAIKTTIPYLCAIDISQKAIDIAIQNSNLHNVTMSFYTTDIFSDMVKLYIEKYSIWVSNPPYVLESEKKDMLSHVLDFEPSTALFVPNDDGLRYYTRIIELFIESENAKDLYFELNALTANELATNVQEIYNLPYILKNDTYDKVRFMYIYK